MTPKPWKWDERTGSLPGDDGPLILETWILVAGVMFFAGLVQGLAGFGSALVAIPLMALFLGMATAVPLMALTAAMMAVINVIHLRRVMRWRPLLPLLGGYLVGTPIGFYFLVAAPEALVLGLLGILLTIYATASLAGRAPRYRWLKEQRVVLGTISGALGSAFSTNGPPIILHVSSQDWPADVKKAVLSLFFLTSSVITVAAFVAGGLVNPTVLDLTFRAIPALILGTVSGIAVYRRISVRSYQRLTFALVLAMGVMMTVRAGLTLL